MHTHRLSLRGAVGELRPVAKSLPVPVLCYRHLLHVTRLNILEEDYFGNQVMFPGPQVKLRWYPSLCSRTLRGCFGLRGQSGVAVTEEAWPAKPQIFSIWLFKEKFASVGLGSREPWLV